ncbi:hypothetical protein M885DRAFT_511196 [Pelagophyceae sp. CCMP2097]|nr:hypothetical protein M885DRAFT_511196 [Pelagophyceae sp. CCMP2097]|mmetsp:Transcript_22487/g.77999  ORF Transcript_22487/g.77999 Transcript_22487/m.77999 type:complete len:162 (+) Transcript_22487:78-563(+)
MPAFSAEEHTLFVEAVEQLDSIEAGVDVWEEIVQHVHTRSSEEVKAHAQYYLMSLQSVDPDIAAHSLGGAWMPTWSAAENVTFEAALATYEEGDADRWASIAALLPGKTAADVQRWYEVLFCDMLEIRNGAKSQSPRNVKPEGGFEAQRQEHPRMAYQPVA